MIQTEVSLFPPILAEHFVWFFFYSGCLMNFVFNQSDTSLNEPEEFKNLPA